MKSKFLFLIPAFIAVFAVCSQAQGPPPRLSECDLKTDMRKLWEDHITWTRNVILNVIDELPGTNEAVARLLQNQADIGNAFVFFYGQDVGDSITALFTVHITTAADLLTALKAGDSAATAAAVQAWYANGEDIVDYLVAINPHYDEAELDEMMDMHLDLTAAEAVARLTQDYAADVAAYDAVHDEMLEMSDFLVNGLIEQFPRYFRGNARVMGVVLTDEIALQQNYPNPFADQTVISYFVPAYIESAVMEFRDVTGRVIKSVVIQERGEGQMTVFAHQLSKGAYTYSIVADGVVQEMKTMLH